MSKTLNKELISSSSAWVAFTLNLIPGIGTGYIYQRRWRAYWITISISFLWILLSIILQAGIDPSDPAPTKFDEINLYGLLAISFVTSIEASIRVRNVRRETSHMS